MENKEEKEFSLKGFEKTLHPKTVRYINNKTSQADKIDLRQLSEKAEKELKTLQNDAAFDYLKVENETYELLEEIKKSDGILGELEDVLKSFRDGLSQVKSEMTFLQERSVNMNVSLNNRKNLSKTFSGFIENVMLEPSLIDNIVKGPIDDENIDFYVDNIKKLCHKLDYIKKYNLLENMCVREIEPELSKLKVKACERIRNFILQEFLSLKKPKTNIHYIQQSKLAKYRLFVLFLRDHNPPIYFEIVENYTQTMNKIYNDNLRIYINELGKIMEDTQTRRDMECAFPDNAENYKTNRFDLSKRIQVLDDVNQQPIITHVAVKNNQRYHPEALFKSLNRLLVETAGQEYTFIQHFFSLDEEQTSVVFAGIFKQTILNVMNKVKGWIKSTFDPFTPLMIIVITSDSKAGFQAKGFDVLDFYFDQINYEAWPRTNDLYDLQMSLFKEQTVQALKGVLGEVTSAEFLSKAIEFLKSLHICAVKATESKDMLCYRITRFLDSTVKLIDQLAEAEGTDSQKFIFIKLSHILYSLEESRALNSNDKDILEKRVEDSKAEVINKIMYSYYPNIMGFVAKEKSGESNPDSQNLTLIENISKEFCETWMSKLTKLRADIEKEYSEYSQVKKLLKGLMTKILDSYNSFYNIVKASYPSYTSNMVPLHKLTIDMKKQIDSLGE